MRMMQLIEEYDEKIENMEPHARVFFSLLAAFICILSLFLAWGILFAYVSDETMDVEAVAEYSRVPWIIVMAIGFYAISYIHALEPEKTYPEDTLPKVKKALVAIICMEIVFIALGLLTMPFVEESQRIPSTFGILGMFVGLWNTVNNRRILLNQLGDTDAVRDV